MAKLWCVQKDPNCCLSQDGRVQWACKTETDIWVLLKGALWLYKEFGIHEVLGTGVGADQGKRNRAHFCH